MRALSFVFCLLLTGGTADAAASCDDVSRLRGLVATIEITVSNLSRANEPAPPAPTVIRVTYSVDRRTVTIRSANSAYPDWLETTECRYDKNHRLVKETVNETTKSDRGRLETERTTTSYQYGDRVSIASSGKRKTYLYQDASGRIVSGLVRGPGKYVEGIEYTYFADHFEARSQWSEIDVSGSERRVFDTYGNCTRLEAPGLLETSTYEFDDVGNWTRRVTMFSGQGVGEGIGVVETRRILYF